MSDQDAPGPALSTSVDNAAPAPEPYRFRPSAPTVEDGDALAVRVLRVFTFEGHEDIFWREDDGILSMLVNCSDVFAWGSADAEEITAENIDLLEDTFAECQAKIGDTLWASHLFCARSRGSRPQGAYYAGLDPDWTALFDACGPERQTGLGNPYTPAQAQARAAAKAASRAATATSGEQA